MTKVGHELTTLLVGGFAKVPGGAVQQVLPAGARLQLVPEPENPYDSHALQVWVDPAEIPQSQVKELTDRLEGTGWDLASVLSGGRIQLGYVAMTGGKPLQKAGLQIGNAEFALAAQQLDLPVEGPWPARLSFNAAGAPMVSLQVEEPEA